jgi:hypothetical protein
LSIEMIKQKPKLIKKIIMKKLLMSALLLIGLATSSFAEGTGSVSSLILRNFTFDFKDATALQWTAGEDYVKASFTYNNERMEAFYDVNGDVFATAKGLSLDQLPTQAKRKFAQKYEGYTVKRIHTL